MYSSEEKETTCVYDYVADEWLVYSCVPKHITKLRKVAGEPFWKEETTGTTGKTLLIAGKWKLTGKQIRFALAERTPAQKEAAKRNVQKMLSNKLS